MLKQRILTALILLPLALAGLFYLQGFWFSLATAGIFLIAAFEWSKLMPINSTYLPKIFILGFLFLMSIMFFTPINWNLTLSTIAMVWWIIALFLVVLYPKQQSFWGVPFGLLLMGWVVLWPSWYALVWLKSLNNGPIIVLYVFCVVWVADTGAFFVGRRWGKKKLAPTVSPGKSVAGLLGGLCLTLLLALWVSQDLNLSPLKMFLVFLLTLVTALASVLGDLFESMIKRFRGVKDSGTILPGHGGILDRIDSLTAALPVFATGWFFAVSGGVA
jgi:phosphatidate cytidylyltransferase